MVVAAESELLAIGELAKQTGVAPSALRYYEERGLLAPARRVGGRRQYHASAVAQVGVLLLLQEVGFTLAEVEELLTSRLGSSGSWRDLANRKLDELDERIRKTQVARVAIEHGLACHHEDLVDCPNFWNVIAARLSGTPLADVEGSGRAQPGES
jgi:MerR family redox-sensitive transcriptional activator SoxR